MMLAVWNEQTEIFRRGVEIEVNVYDDFQCAVRACNDDRANRSHAPFGEFVEIFSDCGQML
jgi:hypothetical protein